MDISHLPLESIDEHSLQTLPYLRALRITASVLPSSSKAFNLPRLLGSQRNLRELWIEAPRSFDDLNKMAVTDSYPVPEVQSTDLSRELDGLLPHKLHHITLSGSHFRSLDAQILQVRSQKPGKFHTNDLQNA